MIYIIDNGQGLPDGEVYLLEIADEEVELFGDTLWPLIKEGWSCDFIIGSTAYINWHDGKAPEDLRVLADTLSLRNMFMQQADCLKRRKSIPPLTAAAIDKVFEWRPPAWRGESFSHYVGQDLRHFSWDEVRRALSVVDDSGLGAE